ncbi:MAG: CDP-diacylglycerol--glycerol-3-phosphate 3-phosphatidyltransferase [Synergistaceae bacterium]|nr:CDP-diacylglycerol--glycerol-3-phosphate 3-phosphatidyltransferase [Synergistaceae bacterium]MBQ3625483.1 CDP-diacylglycerol--glycerol-3-phosphate 3-phosphatidyltransferase [Synergistaceae bacterium]MBQ4418954.1 CDP-diacylglycerol--glycerol-3-phosphate 3-phosphatidyltransferase [Synergistaceae bacterium]MBQ6740399.1 CDP-diacylglycerol--glycerol-3-phosphate 3-phosphatidyltransferase [Synergistaceae bacterium]MBQ6909696.1 CDP-diacylglycerol--glycerol-3-phosphate 3-phosphatidyltransferase [Syne
MSESGSEKRSKVFNVPNTLSLVRVFLAPLVLLFLTIRITAPVKFLDNFNLIETPSWGDVLAGAVFIVAAITDSLDGYIARKHRLVTTLGKFIDPLADKVLVIAAMIALVDLHRVPAWIVLVIITREFVVTGLRLVAAAEGVVIAASKGGKIKTVFQIIALSMLILQVPGGMFVMWIAMILTVWSGMEYLINGSKLLINA